MTSAWLFPLFFAAMWLGISTLLAWSSGWTKLAKSFRASGPMQGEAFRFVSGSLGGSAVPVSYGSCLVVRVGDGGFRLSIMMPFRFLCPPLFIPWNEVESLEQRRVLFMKQTVLRLRGRLTEFSVRGGAASALTAAYARAALAGRR